MVARRPPYTPELISQRPVGRRASPSAGRVKNFSSGETIGNMTAASAHSAEYHGRRTGDEKRRMEAVMLRAFLDANPAADHEVARSRSIKSVDNKIKIMRTRYNDACEDFKRTGLSADEKDNNLLKFGGRVLFGPCRSAFESCPVSAQASARDPVFFRSARTVATARTAAGGAASAAVAQGVAGSASAAGGACAARAAEGSGCDGDDCTDDDGGADEEEGSGADGGESDSSEDSMAHSSMVSPREKTDTEIAAASPSKKAKKKTTSAAVRIYFEFKLLSKKAAADAAAGRRRGRGGGGGGGGDGASVNGPTDGDLRQAAINMMNSFAYKAHRA